MPGTIPLFTIGYEGKTSEEFLAELSAAGIGTLVDIRRRAMSRKKGFAKSALKANLATAGIGYDHLPDLGAPTDIIRMKDNPDHTPMLLEYERRLPEAIIAIEQLMAMIKGSAEDQPLCLMCFEADPLRCHRHVLTRFLVEQQGMSLDVTDL